MQPNLFTTLETELLNVPIASINPPCLTRCDNSTDASMKALGRLSAILLKPSRHPGYSYDLVDGEGRYENAVRLGDTTIYGVICRGDATSIRAARAAMNLCRSPNPVSEARAVRDLLEGGLTVSAIADALGIKSQTLRANQAILKLPGDVLDRIPTTLAMGVARAVAVAPDDIRERAIDCIRRLKSDERFNALVLTELKSATRLELDAILERAVETGRPGAPPAAMPPLLTEFNDPTLDAAAAVVGSPAIRALLRAGFGIHLQPRTSDAPAMQRAEA